MPNFVIPFIHYTPNFSAILTIAPIALVTIAEHIGDHTALSAIMNRDLLKDPGLDRTLLGDGLATFVAGAIGGPANTTYGENTSVVGMTRVASVWVIGLAAIIAIALGFFSKFTALVSTIPNAVLGGVSLLLYGFIAVNGLKVLIQNQVNFNNTKNVIVASAMLVLGLGGAAISIVSGDLSVTISGMSLAAIVGILLNLCLPGEKVEKEENAANKLEDKITKKTKKEATEKNVGVTLQGDPKTKNTKKSTAKGKNVKDSKDNKSQSKGIKNDASKTKEIVKKETTKGKTETKKETEKKKSSKEKTAEEKLKATRKRTTTSKTTAQKKTTSKPKTSTKKSSTPTSKRKTTKKEEANV